MFYLVKLCRLCLSCNGEFTSTRNENVMEKVLTCINDLEFNEKIPTFICSKCLQQVDEFLKFRRVCLHSDTVWKKFVEKMNCKDVPQSVSAELKVNVLRNFARTTQFLNNVQFSKPETDAVIDLLEVDVYEPMNAENLQNSIFSDDEDDIFVEDEEEEEEEDLAVAHAQNGSVVVDKQGLEGVHSKRKFNFENCSIKKLKLNNIVDKENSAGCNELQESDLCDIQESLADRVKLRNRNVQENNQEYPDDVTTNQSEVPFQENISKHIEQERQPNQDQENKKTTECIESTQSIDNQEQVAKGSIEAINLQDSKRNIFVYSVDDEAVSIPEQTGIDKVTHLNSEFKQFRSKTINLLLRGKVRTNCIKKINTIINRSIATFKNIIKETFDSNKCNACVPVTDVVSMSQLQSLVDQNEIVFNDIPRSSNDNTMNRNDSTTKAISSVNELHTNTDFEGSITTHVIKEAVDFESSLAAHVVFNKKPKSKPKQKSNNEPSTNHMRKKNNESVCNMSQNTMLDSLETNITPALVTPSCTKIPLEDHCYCEPNSNNVVTNINEDTPNSNSIGNIYDLPDNGSDSDIDIDVDIHSDYDIKSEINDDFFESNHTFTPTEHFPLSIKEDTKCEGGKTYDVPDENITIEDRFDLHKSPNVDNLSSITDHSIASSTTTKTRNEVKNNNRLQTIIESAINRKNRANKIDIDDPLGILIARTERQKRRKRGSANKKKRRKRKAEIKRPDSKKERKKRLVPQNSEMQSLVIQRYSSEVSRIDQECSDDSEIDVVSVSDDKSNEIVESSIAKIISRVQQERTRRYELRYLCGILWSSMGNTSMYKTSLLSVITAANEYIHNLNVKQAEFELEYNDLLRKRDELKLRLSSLENIDVDTNII